MDEILAEYSLTREDAEILTADEAAPAELSELIGSELENANYHSLTRLPGAILEELVADGVPEELQLKVLHALVRSLGPLL